MEIRRLIVGLDTKNGMNYIVGQSVLDGSQKIHLIKKEDDSVKIWTINPKNEVQIWKEFNMSMPLSFEYDTNA